MLLGDVVLQGGEVRGADRAVGAGGRDVRLLLAAQRGENADAEGEPPVENVVEAQPESRPGAA